MKSIFWKISQRASSLERRLIHDPLLTVPEFQGRVTASEQRRSGSESLSHQAIADNLLFGVQYLVGASVEGDVAEFGTATGRTAAVLAASMASFKSPKNLHLFDSFEGLPESTNATDTASFHVRDGVWGPGTCRGISASSLRRKCEEYLSKTQVHIYEGWFSKTLTQVSSQTRFGLLHVDCDLYQSTIDVLDYLFGKQMVAEGALVLFDDWDCNRASNALGERKAWEEIVGKYSIKSSDHGAYSWCGHKFIVHAYNGMGH